jgi:prophage regulatory protein
MQEHCQPERALRQAEVCQRFGISRSTLWAWVKRGSCPRPFHIGRSARWREAELNDFIKSRGGSL